MKKIWCIRFFIIFVLTIINCNAKSENTYLTYSPIRSCTFLSVNSVMVGDSPSSIGLIHFMRKYKYSIGQQINNFIIIEYIGKNKWKAQCNCGNIIVIRTDRVSILKSCGCLSNRFSKLIEGNLGPINSSFSSYKFVSKKRHLEWNLTPSDFLNLVTKNCNYCGDTPNNIMKNKGVSMLLNGIDRVDNEKGYIPNNVVPCCKNCNRAKSNMAIEEFNEWLNRLIKFNINKNEIFDKPINKRNIYSEEIEIRRLAIPSKNGMKLPEQRERLKNNNPMHDKSILDEFFIGNKNPNAKKVKVVSNNKIYTTIIECTKDLKISKDVFYTMVKNKLIIYI